MFCSSRVWYISHSETVGVGVPHQVRFVLMALVGMMMIVNLYFCEENCFQKIQKEKAKESGNAWALTFALLVQSVVLIAPAMVGMSIGV